MLNVLNIPPPLKGPPSTHQNQMKEMQMKIETILRVSKKQKKNRIRAQKYSTD